MNDLERYESMRKSAEQSSSAFGQYMSEKHPKTFFWCDIDGVIMKNMTGMLRVIEHKYVGQPVKPSQRAVLPLLAMGINCMKMVGRVHAESGVFVVWADAPFDKSILVSEVVPTVGFRVTEPVELDGVEKNCFLQGMPINEKRCADF